MQSKLQDLTRDETLRTEKYDMTMAKAKERYDVMEKQFETQIEEIQRRLQLFQKARTEMVKAHSDDNAARVERFTEIAEVWKTHIADNGVGQPAVATPPPSVQAPAMVVEPDVEPTAETDYHLSVPWTPGDLPETVPVPLESTSTG